MVRWSHSYSTLQRPCVCACISGSVRFVMKDGADGLRVRAVDQTRTV
jgi:hypothetical protein